MAHAHTVPSKEDIALLPPFPRLGVHAITLVQTAAQALAAWERLSQSPVWGFDTESKPTFSVGETSDGPHVLQLATTSHAWVIQLHDADCRATVATWMAHPAFTKVGFGLGDDKKRMLHKFGVEPTGVVDLNHLFHQRGWRKDMGVKGAVAVVFGQNFAKSKKAATSNWANAELSESQVVYAANDAFAAACVYSAMRAAAA
jgi:ribonuclease D